MNRIFIFECCVFRLRVNHIFRVSLIALMFFISHNISAQSSLINLIDKDSVRFAITTLDEDITIDEIEALIKNQNPLSISWHDFDKLLSISKNKDILLSFTLDNLNEDNSTLLIYGHIFNLSLIFNNELVFEARTLNYAPFEIFLIDLPTNKLNSNNFVFHIRFNNIHQIGEFMGMFIGSKEQIEIKQHEISQLLYRNVFYASFLGGFFIITSVLLLIFCVFKKTYNHLIMYVFIFALGCGFDQLEYLSIKKVSMLFALSPQIIFSLGMLIPIGFWGILRNFSSSRFSKIFNYLICINVLFWVAIIILPVTILVIYNIMISIQILFAVIMITLSSKFRNFSSYIINISIIIYVITTINQFFTFSSFLITFSSIGALPLFVTLCVIALNEYWSSHKKIKEANERIHGAQVKLVKLESENILSQYQALQNQLNPHFLFNSLNVLSSLIRRDQHKSIEFVNLFSDIYRYVLQSRNHNLILLENELVFV